MKPYHKLLFASLLMLPFFSKAQTNYKPGYIILKQGDTVKGFIDYHDWDSNPTVVNFKSASASSVEKVTPKKVNAFAAQIGHLAKYESYAGPISMDNVDINRLSIERDTSFIIDTVFLRVLQDGKKLQLLSYTDNKKTRYFISGGASDRPTELKYRVYNKEQGSATPTVYETDYKGQLYDAAIKAGIMTPALKNQISGSNYTGESISQVTAVINGVSARDLTQNSIHKMKTSSYVLIFLAAAAVIAFVIHDMIAVGHH